MKFVLLFLIAVAYFWWIQKADCLENKQTNDGKTVIILDKDENNLEVFESTFVKHIENGKMHDNIEKIKEKCAIEEKKCKLIIYDKNEIKEKKIVNQKDFGCSEQTVGVKASKEIICFLHDFLMSLTFHLSLFLLGRLLKDLWNYITKN